MSRPLRIEYENAFYHVMNRGRGLSDDDFKYFLYCMNQRGLNQRGQILTLDIKSLDL